MHRHGRTAAIDMYFGGGILKGEVGNMPCKYYMRSAGDILYIDKLVHENWF